MGKTRLILCVVFAAIGCSSGPASVSYDVHQDDALPDGGVKCVAGKDIGHVCDPSDTKKTTICHIPPGNPANAHTLCVGSPAVPAHLAHGDHTGPCTCVVSDAGSTPSPSNDAGSNGPPTGKPGTDMSGPPIL
jgi:hypothetical protein